MIAVLFSLFISQFARALDVDQKMHIGGAV